MAALKNLIFDLGGVLLNIDYHKTANAFKALGAGHFDDLYSQVTANELFEKLETGHISEPEFYREILLHCQPGTSDEQAEAAWNAILLDFRKDSLKYLEQLKDHYNLFLLSNTNSIHIKAFDDILKKEVGGKSLDEYFTKSYYSNRIHMRKPYGDTYKFVLEDGGMKLVDTLFIDDSLVNIEGAKSIGMQTHLLLPTEKIEDLNLL